MALPSINPYQQAGVDHTVPASGGEAVTPHNTNYFAKMARALYVGTGGNIVVVLADGTTTLTFVAVPTGSILPIVCSRVNSTNTTASDIIALY
jgi:hypothetical protein